VSTIHERIKSQRLKSGYTLAEVADLLGVKEPTVQRYESGEIKNIKHETITKLASIFHTTPAYLMGWIGSDSPENKKNDIISDIILRLKADEQFLDVVVGVADLSKDQLAAVKTFLSAFK
jgi:transcriptional regulator with XRE-family HTH domain